MTVTFWTITMTWMTVFHLPQKLNYMLLVGVLGQCGGRPNTGQHLHQKASKLPGMRVPAVVIQMPVAVALDPPLHQPLGQAHLPQDHPNPNPFTDPKYHRHHRQVTLPAITTLQGQLTLWHT